MASFDRRKCKAAQRPDRDRRALSGGLDDLSVARAALRGRHRAGNRQRRVELLHLGRPARHFGLGKNIPIATGNNSDSLLVLVDGKWVHLRVPYPMGFFAKGLDGRIDDPNAGWKGRGLWATYGNRTPFHIEGGKGTQPKVVKFQLRPDPLAR